MIKRENLKILRLLHLLFALSLSPFVLFVIVVNFIYARCCQHFINLCVGVNMRVKLNLMHCKAHTDTHEHIFFKVVDEEIFNFRQYLNELCETCEILFFRYFGAFLLRLLPSSCSLCVLLAHCRLLIHKFIKILNFM